MDKLDEIYTKSLCESAKAILKRVADTGFISDNDLAVLLMYKQEREKASKKPLLPTLLDGFKQVSEFINTNLGGDK